MDPRRSEGDKGEDDVRVEEGLVEGVAHRRQRQDQNGDHGGCTDHSGADEAVIECLLFDARPAIVGYLDDGPCNQVKEHLEDHDTAHPSMKKIICVEADL